MYNLFRKIVNLQAMVRAKRRNRTAILESSDDEEEFSSPRKRLKSTPSKKTKDNQSFRTKRKKSDSSKSKKSSNRKNSSPGIAYNFSSSDDEEEIAPSSSSARSSRNLNRSKAKNNKTVIDSSIGSFIVTSKRKPLSITSGYSSVSGDDENIRHCRSGKMRVTSDNETRDSNENCPEPSLNCDNTDQAWPNSPAGDNEDFDPSSDDNITRPNKKKKNSSFLSTTSDSSDASEIVVAHQSSRKLRRIVSTSEESDSDSSSYEINTINEPGRRNGRLEGFDRSFNNIRNQTQQTTRQLRSRSTNQTAESSGVQLRQGNNHRTRGRRSGYERESQNRREPRYRSVNESSSSQEDSMSSISSSDLSSESDSSSPVRSFRITYRPLNSVVRSFGTRILRNRIIPDLFSSDESDISLPNSNRRRRGALVTIQESDEDTPWVTTQESNENTPCENKNDSSSKSNPVFQSSSSSDSDGESEKCSICFTRFDTQEIGSPASCEHSFCIACIQEWAKNSNTCPIDRKVFDRIIVRSQLEGEVVREVEVQPPTRNFWEGTWDLLADLVMGMEEVYNPDFFNDEGPEEICLLCHDPNRTDNLIVCDYCDGVYHMSCLDPPLRSIPVGEWSCPNCIVEEMDLDLL